MPDQNARRPEKPETRERASTAGALPGAGFDAAEAERRDPGHFARQGDYDDPGASLMHDDGVIPGRRSARASAPVDTKSAPDARGQETDPEYLAWREAELKALDADYQAWRQQQAEAYDAAYRMWRDAPGDTPFAQWREAAAASLDIRRTWSRRRETG
ncbi:hypothetical protein ACLBXM_00310 [Xanthobacteraceae bacterium A53D]